MVNYPKDWNKETLGNLCKIKTGTRNNEEKISNGVYPFFVRSDKVERINSFSYDTEAILVPGEGNIGSIYHYINGKFDVHQRVYAITNFSEEVSARYIYWFMFKYFGSYALQNTSRATVDSLRLPVFENFYVYYPDLSEQQAITETLTAFDKHIENLEELIAKKQMIRDGAVEDLMSGKTRLDGFDGEWEEEMLNNKCRVFDGTHQTPTYTQTGIKFVSVEDINDIYDSTKFISAYDYTRGYKVFPELGDVLMTRIGDIGTPALVNKKERLAYYVSLALLKNIKINSEYLYHYISCNEFKAELDARTLHHATPKKINKNEIGKCIIKYPIDIKEQKAIADILSAMDEEIENLRQEKDKIEKIKVGAMDNLLTGKIRLVKEA